MATKQTMQSSEIIELLRQRHAGDSAYSEVKTGSTTMARKGELRKLDFWAMLPTWSPPTAIGYEIKVSRSDFLKDNKWPEYLNYCNQFYFVAPNGLIKPDEIPPEVGLMTVTTNRTGLLTKKKAPHRDVVIPESLWRYILMSKVNSFPRTREDWGEELKGKEADRAIGRVNSKKIRKLVTSRISEIEQENHLLQYRMKQYDQFKQALADYGFDPEHLPSRWDLKRQLQEHQSMFDEELKRKLKQACNVLLQLSAEIEEAEHRLKEKLDPSPVLVPEIESEDEYEWDDEE